MSSRSIVGSVVLRCVLPLFGAILSACARSLSLSFWACLGRHTSKTTTKKRSNRRQRQIQQQRQQPQQPTETREPLHCRRYFVEVVNKHSGDRSASSQSQQGSGSRTLGGGTRGHPSLPGDLPGNGKARLASSGKTTETPLGQYQTLPSGISEAVVPQTSGGGGSDGGSGADQGIGSGSTVDENRDFVRV